MTQIKTKVIETSKARVLVVDMPVDAFGIAIYDGDINWMDSNGHRIEEVPNGDWQLLGRLSEITEEQTLATIVGRGFKNYNVCQQLNQHPQYDMYWVKYPDGSHNHFNTKDECYAHALKMELLSLIESEVLLRNPHGEKPKRYVPFMGEGHYTQNQLDEIADYENELSNWDQAEDQVFHNPHLWYESKLKQ